MSRFRLVLSIGLLTAIPAPAARADEGLWTFEEAGQPAVAPRLGMSGGEAARERMRGNVVRFASGASGTLVSARGLVVTVRGVAVPCLHAWSKSGTDFVEKGFQAGDGQDLGCPDMSLERIVGSDDVTKRLRAGLGAAEPIPEDRIAALEKECRTQAGIECRVTVLFGGAAAKLERYRRHDDIRLVFAPEHDIAAYGTPLARMSFPRFSLDVAFFRIYDKGRPLESGPPLPWHPAGAKEDDRIVIAGYPRETERHLPWVFLELLGSSVYRLEAQLARAQAGALLHLSAGATEPAVQEESRAQLEHVGTLLADTVAVLQNDAFRRRQRTSEAGWRRLLESGNPQSAKTAWASAAAAHAAYAKFYRRHVLIEGDRVRPFGRLFDLGRKLVRLSEQKSRAEGERSPEYRGARLAALERELSSPVALAPAAERSLIETGLAQLRGQLGARDPLVAALGPEKPDVTAARIVAATRLFDASARKSVVAQGKLGDAAADPLIVLVKAVEAEAWPLHERYENEVARNLAVFSRELGQRLGSDGGATDPHYSDAHHDLRFSSGHVVGYQAARRVVPAHTTMAGLVARAAWSRPGSPWALPPRWRDRKGSIALTTAINFVTDADVGGGAPGAAVLNQQGQVTGVIIDVTRQSGVNRFLYRGGENRAIAVDAAGISEALRHVYDASKLLAELGGGGA